MNDLVFLKWAVRREIPGTDKTELARFVCVKNRSTLIDFYFAVPTEWLREYDQNPECAAAGKIAGEYIVALRDACEKFLGPGEFSLAYNIAVVCDWLPTTPAPTESP